MNIFSRLTHMFSDGIKQDQPKNTYSDAIGYTGIKGSEGAGFVTSSTGNIAWIGLPNDYKLRGEKYMPEYDQWIFMGISGGKSEIGVADHRTKKYTKLVDDSLLDRPLGLKADVWTKIEVNVHANCNRIKVYFHTNRIYRVVELYDPCCNFENTLLMKPTCISSLHVEAIKGMGNLVNGSYRASIKVFDKDLNDTNFAQISQPITVADGDYRIDEVTNYGLVIEGFNMPADYNMAELVIIENTTGANAYKVINDVGFGEGYFHYVYTGSEGYYADGKLADILNRKQQYFRGEGIAEHDNALLLFNVEPQRNYNLQKIVNGFRVGYKRWMVPTKYADKYKGLRENENYDFCIWYNGKDGTRTIAYPFVNHLYGGDSTSVPGSAGNCQNCDIPLWATMDTSQQTRLFFEEACSTNRAFKKTYTNRLNRKRTYERNPRSNVDSNGNTTSKKDRSRRSVVGPRNTSTELGVEADNGAETNNIQELQHTGTQELCDLTSPCLSTFNVVYNEIKAAFYILINSIREGFGLPLINFPDTQTPDCVCSLAASIDTYLDQKYKPMLDEAEGKYRTQYDKTRYIETSYDCTNEGEIRCGGTQVCYECVGGKWNYVNNSISYKNRPVPLSVSGNKETTINRNPIGISLDFSGAQNNLGGSLGDNNPWGNNCIDEIGQPIAYSEGNFGYWETNAKYPETIGRDDCEPIFGEYAGHNQRLFKVPSLGKEPHFLSFADGVPSKQNIGNDEIQNSFVIFTAPRFYNISIPEVIQDWVCQKNPFTIGYAQRDESNKTVISTGVLHGTMLGNIQGDEYLIPKHAVNSFEFVDQSINPGGTNTLRIGSSTNIPAYIYHSPDYHMYGNYQNGHYALFQMELDGAGYRHGLYAEGEKPNTPYEPKYNQAGARQGINLNHYICRPNPLFRCIKGMADAPANSIVGKDAGSNFTKSLVNLFRESSQYIEFEGSKPGFTQDALGPYNSLNGGDGESDNSFTGDTINHETFIDNSRAHLITVMRYLPNQYGPVISRAYIPIGLNATYATGQMPKNNIKIEGLVGDSFIGPFSYKRTSFVSDKVPENISPVSTFGLDVEVEDGNLITRLLRLVFIAFLRNIIKVLGWEEIGTVPDTGDEDDDRNWFGGLRNEWGGYTSSGSPGGPTSSTTTPEFPDTYMPHMVKTYILSFLTSDANLNYRGTGNIVFGDDGVAEVHRYKLKTLNLDSTMPDGQNIFRSWLNRVSLLMKEPARWKMILRLVLRFLWKYGVGIYIMFVGIKLFFLAWPLAGGYIVSATGTMALVGAAIKLIAAAFIIFLGYLWIQIWKEQDLDNKIIDTAIGIEWAHPDKVFREANETGQGSRWGMFPARVKDFENNYWYYNLTFSMVNEGEICFGMPYYYDTEYCPDKFTNRIISSNMQNPSSEIDAWRQFKPNHYIDIPRNRGKITILFSNQGQLYAQTTDTTFQISYNGNITSQMTNEELLLGRMYMFGRSQDIYGAVTEGYGGNKDPNAAKETAMGFFYFDRDARRIKVFGNSDIPFSGIEEFMDDNLKFHILDYFPNFPIQDQKCETGVHFDFAIDHGNSKIYIYKKDFIPASGVSYKDGKLQDADGKQVELGDPSYFTDKSFVYEYCMRQRAWKSRHYWRPGVLLFNRYNMFAVKGKAVWSFDTKSLYNNFFGEQFPSYIEIPLSNADYHNSYILKNIKIIGELIEIGADGVEMELDEPLYDVYQIYNGRQNSGWISLRKISTSDDENLINDINETEEAKWSRKGNGTIIEEFKNYIPSKVPVLSTYNKRLDIMDVGSILGEDNGVFEDDFIVLRLLSHKKSNQKIHLRKILLDFNLEQDG